MTYLEKYFLRRLAVERQDKHFAQEAPFRNAVVDLATLAFGVPITSIVTCILIATMHWWDARWPWLSFRWAAALVGIPSLIAGYFFFGRLFKKYKLDPAYADRYGSMEDRRIAFWQRFLALVFFSAVLPWLGILINLHFK